MNVEELKAEAAKLPPNDRFALAEWIGRNEDIGELRHAALVRERAGVFLTLRLCYRNCRTDASSWAGESGGTLATRPGIADTRPP